MTEEQQAIIELAEVVKELVRIIGITNSKLPDHLKNRLEAVYKKATAAKNRVDMVKEKLPKRMTRDEWNNLYFSRVTPVKGPGGFLMVYQTMNAYCMFEGVKYLVTGWAPPNGEAQYVEAREVTDETDQDRPDKML